MSSEPTGGEGLLVGDFGGEGGFTFGDFGDLTFGDLTFGDFGDLTVGGGVPLEYPMAFLSFPTLAPDDLANFFIFAIVSLISFTHALFVFSERSFLFCT